MPFLGRDWRGDGEMWVRTDRGWETVKNWRIRIHENINLSVLQKLVRQSLDGDVDFELIECSRRPIHIHIPKTALFNISQSEVIFSQALNTLDFNGAFKDPLREDYAYKVLSLIINENVVLLSGTIRNHLVGLLESALSQACETGSQKNRLITLLEKMVGLLTTCPVHIICGDILWTKHCNDLSRMLDKARAIQVPGRRDDNGIKLQQLPTEILRHIVLFLTSQQDISNSGKADPHIHEIVEDNSLWKDLCYSHFDTPQIQSVIYRYRGEPEPDINNIHWYKIYHILNKRFGFVESYSDVLCFCAVCRTAFWKTGGHPCKCEENPDKVSILTPAQFIAMFHL